MPPRTVIGILSPFTGGFYYGAVLEGILRAAHAEGPATVAFETARLHLVSSDDTGARVLGSDRVDGWLAINEFDDPDLLARLRERGKAIVHVHAQPQAPDGCAVLPDNEGGTRAVTEHLIQHGHRRIAFAGSVDQVDVAERFAGYEAALASQGLPVDPALNFSTPWNLEGDGRAAAARLLSMRASPGWQTPPTAVVAATDKIALGLVAALSDAGLRVPRDIAVTGFDDTHAAQFAKPPLTTVRQSFGAVGAAALKHLLAAVRQGVPLPRTVRMPTQLIVRRSCGCVVSQSRPPRVSTGPSERAATLRTELLRLAGRDRMRALAPSEWPDAERIANALDATVRGDLDALEPVAGDWWAGFLERNRDAESVIRMMCLLESTLRAWCPDLDEQPEVGGILRDVRIALMHSWQRAERVMVAHYESVSEAASRMAGALGATGTDPCRDLGWIRWSNARSACCALWTGRPSLRPPASLGASPALGALEIVGEYAAGEGAPAPDRPKILAPADFPPVDLLESAFEAGAMLTVTNIPRGAEGSYGLLAVATLLEYEQLDYVGSPGDWAAQLGAALDRANAEHELRVSAAFDALTRLPNRTTLLQRLEELRTSETGTFAVLFIDLDDFKKVNDSLGHEAGDRLLVQIAERLTAEVGGALGGGQARRRTAPIPGEASPMVARLGGDEFVVVLAGIESEDEAIAIAQRLQTCLTQPYSLGADTVFVSGSIGVNFGRGSEFTAQDLLRDADTAMYRAKLRGRACHEVFHHGMHVQAMEKLRLDARLRLALERNELELWYQPIVALVTGRDVGAEALIRWRHPEQGLLGPGRFLAVAEDVGLSIPLSEWVIRRACDEAARWQSVATAPFYVNVNVPAAHVKQPGFVEFVARALSDSGLNPRAFGVEIVENALMDEPAKCATALSGLMALGARVAIDDFGTGYSSLSYLRDFPASALKIDRTFVRNLPQSARDSGIARAIIAMGQGLGLSVVAEGIETKEQLDFLTQAGCDLGQGYHLGHPAEWQACNERLLRAAREGGPEAHVPRRRRSSHSPTEIT